jgi:hypothetical protein
MGPSTSRPSASPTDAARHLHQRRRNRRPRHQFPRWTRSTSTKCSFRGSPRGRPHELGRRRPHIRDCKFTGNQGAAIRTLSTTAGQAGIIHVSVTRTTANRNQQGIRFEGNSFGVVSNSTASNNTLNGFVVFPQSVSGAEMNIVDSDANNNKQFGVFVGGTGQSGVVRIFNLTASTTRPTSCRSMRAVRSCPTAGTISVSTNAPGPFTDQ